MDNILTNYIQYQLWLDILQRADITKGEKDFNSKEIHDLGNYYDENYQYLDMEKIQEFEVVTPTYVLVPKYFWIENYEKLKDLNAYLNIEDRVKSYEWDYQTPEEIKNLSSIYETSITLRPEQSVAFEVIEELRYSKKLFRGILQATAGWGKTLFTVNFIEKLKFQKPLIIVPKEILAHQFKDSFIEHSSLTEDDIFMLEGSDEDKIEENLKNCKVVIAKVQSLLSQIKRNKYEALHKIYENIDLVVYDEVHSSGAKGYGKVSSLFRTSNVLGLTATPYRRGFNDFMLKNSTGEVIYKSEHKNIQPDVQIFNLPSGPNSNMEFTPKDLKTLDWCKNDYIKFLTFHNMLLYEKDWYFEYLADWTHYQQQMGHDSVVLFSTNKMIDKFITIYNNKFPDNINTNFEPLKLIGDSKTDSQKIAKERNKELKQELREYKESLNNQVKLKEIKRKEADTLYKEKREILKKTQDNNLEYAIDLYQEKIKNTKLIVSNFQLLSAGFDKSSLSHIIFGSIIIGKVTVLQSIGRIARLHEGKQFPLVQFFFNSTFIDYQDKSPMILKNNIKSEYPESKIKWEGW
jgi:hypothetical protein